MEYIYVDELIRLRHHEKSDIEHALRWYSDPVVLNGTIAPGRTEPCSHDMIAAMYDDLSKNAELFIIEALDQTDWLPIGDVTLSKDFMPIVIGDRKFRGKGISKKVLLKVIDLAKLRGFREINLKEIYRENAASIRLFEGVGFRKVAETKNGFSYSLNLLSLDLQLSNLVKSDLPLIHQWFNDPRAAGEYDGVPGISLEKIAKKLEAGRFSGLRVVSFKGEKIGWTEMNVFAESSTSANLTVQISCPEFRGQGLGKCIHELAITDFLKSHLDVQFIEVWTHALNVAEQRILTSLNFVKHDDEGRMFDINGVPQPFISYELKVLRENL